jgi:hypothetical protein
LPSSDAHTVTDNLTLARLIIDPSIHPSPIAIQPRRWVMAPPSFNRSCIIIAIALPMAHAFLSSISFLDILVFRFMPFHRNVLDTFLKLFHANYTPFGQRALLLQPFYFSILPPRISPMLSHIYTDDYRINPESEGTRKGLRGRTNFEYVGEAPIARRSFNFYRSATYPGRS